MWLWEEITWLWRGLRASSYETVREITAISAEVREQMPWLPNPCPVIIGLPLLTVAAIVTTISGALPVELLRTLLLVSLLAPTLLLTWLTHQRTRRTLRENWAEIEAIEDRIELLISEQPRDYPW